MTHTETNSRTRAPRREHRIELTLNSIELNTISAAAAAAGYPPATWLRMVGSAGGTTTAVPRVRTLSPEFSAAVAELARHAHDLARFGVLLDSLVHHLNTSKAAAVEVDPRNVAKLLEAAMQVLAARKAIRNTADAVQEVRKTLLRVDL